MSDINKVLIIGRLTRDIEIKTTNNGGFVGKFSLASNRKEKSGDTWTEKPGFFDCVVFGKSAEILKQYTRKGSKLCVDGSLRWSSWEGTDGKKQSKVEIHVKGFQFLDAKPEGASEPGEPSAAHFDTGALSDDDVPF
jgi:single-strand DNA-binding protein